MSELSPQEEAMVLNWERHASGDWGKTVPMHPGVSLRYELNFYRQKWDRIYRRLVATNDVAKRLAERNGWLDGEKRRRAAAASVHTETKRDGEIFP